MMDGSRCETKTFDQPIEIILNESRCIIKPMISPIKKHYVLLGIDWFKATGALIDPASKSIYFKSVNYSRDEDSSSEQEVCITKLDGYMDEDELANLACGGTYSICTEASEEETPKMEQLLQEFDDIFAKQEGELAKCN